MAHKVECMREWSVHRLCESTLLLDGIHSHAVGCTAAEAHHGPRPDPARTLALQQSACIPISRLVK